MLQNYLRVALRALRRQKGYTAINIVGLAVGMTCCILILLYVQDERSYDRHFEDAEHIYRLRVERFSSNGEEELTATSSAPMGPAALETLPQIAAQTRFLQRTYLVRYEDRQFFEDDFFWADSTTFEVFSFPFLAGDAATALQRPYSLVVTESSARKYFGTTDVLGRVLRVEDMDMTITGVLADVPPQTHLTFDFLASMATRTERWGDSGNWWGLSYYTYFRVPASTDMEALQAGLLELPRRYIADQEDGSGYRQFLYLQPVTDIHLRSQYTGEWGTNSDVAYVYVFSAIALFILLIACINFMNLATARSMQRAKEVSLRKVVGASKQQLVGQFLGESVLLSLLALVLAMILIQVLIGPFNTLAGKSLSLNYLTDAPLTGLLVAFALSVGLLAGLYPAFVLSSFEALDVFRGKVRSGRAGALLRQGLVVFQFAISVVLIVGALVVFQQLDYMQSQNLGFEKEQTVVLNARGQDEFHDRYQSLKDQLEAVPSVQSVTVTSSVPGRDTGTNVISRTAGMTEDGQTLLTVAVDHDYLETYGLELVAGRGFDESFTTDAEAAFVINEATVRALGWTDPAQAIGQEITRQFSDTRTVIGVVKDFHYQSLQHAVEPLVFFVRPGWFSYVSVRVTTEDMPATMAQIDAAWQQFSPSRPLDAFFLDDDYDRQYRTEVRTSRILNIFTLLAIGIACLGLFALAAFMTQQRTKEIGVRKVLGASVFGLVGLLARDFTKWVLLAIVLAIPVAYFALNAWLNSFAYRIDLGVGVFLLAGVLALAIAWLTISYQSIRAALLNPVRALRYE